MAKEYLIPCYILHRRPYGESSAIIDVVAEGFGRLSLVLRGVYQQKKSAVGALAQGFRPLLISFSDKGELKTALALEDNGTVLKFTGKYLYSGFYINELICRLWPQNISEDDLFTFYQQTLLALAKCQKCVDQQIDQQIDQQSAQLEAVLRRFEWQLLNELGYGIDCFYTCDNQQRIVATQNYLFLPQQGFTLAEQQLPYSQHRQRFNGAELLAIAELDFFQPGVLKAAKRLNRLILTAYLGHKPLKSRELFMTMGNPG